MIMFGWFKNTPSKMAKKREKKKRMALSAANLILRGDGWFGLIMGVCVHQGADDALSRIISDGTYVYSLAFRDEEALTAYLEKSPEIRVVATGDELVARYADAIGLPENDLQRSPDALGLPEDHPLRTEGEAMRIASVRALYGS